METIKQKLSSSDNYTVSSGDQESEGKLVEQNTIAWIQNAVTNKTSMSTIVYGVMLKDHTYQVLDGAILTARAGKDW